MLRRRTDVLDVGDRAISASGVHRRLRDLGGSGMDARRFDALSRTLSAVASRRRALHGLAAACGLAVLGDAEAKKKRKNRKKKRCKKLRQPCQPEGRKCCNDRTCGGPPASRFCCQQGGEPCSGNGDCCNQQCFENACALN